eukprot:1332622-Amorphochlora_amoeboformis.AAC.1
MQWSWCVIGVVLASNVFTAAIMMWIFTRKDSQTLPNVNKPPGDPHSVAWNHPFRLSILVGRGSVCAVAESTEGLCNAVVDRRPFSDLATWEREIIKQVAASGPVIYLDMSHDAPVLVFDRIRDVHIISRGTGMKSSLSYLRMYGGRQRHLNILTIGTCRVP